MQCNPISGNHYTGSASIRIRTVIKSIKTSFMLDVTFSLPFDGYLRGGLVI